MSLDTPKVERPLSKSGAERHVGSNPTPGI